ncbi:HNH endonuclease [Lacticaseibacillus parakribbianus]|uniref:HNH endonuclease n=1 Tax=Lacticaseibacillus parakribbianus TaxID=2970927 RepID=UPI0021CAFD4F|nr:HNH endonuclease [Lacticaseibacillus parakribbianus]
MIDTQTAHKLDKRNKREIMQTGAERFYDLDDMAFVRDTAGAFKPSSTAGWKRCPAPWSSYFTNAEGQVMGLNGAVLTTSVNNGGYEVLTGTKDDGRQTMVPVHRLVALAWLDNPDHLSDTDHLDGNRRNNDLSNLRWLSHASNLKGRRGSFKGHEVTCRDTEGRLVGTYPSINQAHHETGLSSQTIAGICNGNYPAESARGLTFSYADSNTSELLNVEK